MQLTFKNITVLGSGIMGHGIAQVAATAGCKVALRDIKDEFLDNAMQKIRWSLDKMAKKGRITPEDADRIYERITPYTDLSEALKGCEMVIEAVPEIMDLKKKVYAELESSAPENAVFASNTSRCSMILFIPTQIWVSLNKSKICCLFNLSYIACSVCNKPCCIIQQVCKYWNGLYFLPISSESFTRS